MTIIKHRKHTNAKTICRSIRIPIPLDTRIAELAAKRLITKSAWIIKTLERETKVKRS